MAKTPAPKMPMAKKAPPFAAAKAPKTAGKTAVDPKADARAARKARMSKVKL